jgi:hypothetical protein
MCVLANIKSNLQPKFWAFESILCKANKKSQRTQCYKHGDNGEVRSHHHSHLPRKKKKEKKKEKTMVLVRMVVFVKH